MGRISPSVLVIPYHHLCCPLQARNSYSRVLFSPSVLSRGDLESWALFEVEVASQEFCQNMFPGQIQQKCEEGVSQGMGHDEFGGAFVRFGGAEPGPSTEGFPPPDISGLTRGTEAALGR